MEALTNIVLICYAVGAVIVFGLAIAFFYAAWRR